MRFDAIAKARARNARTEKRWARGSTLCEVVRAAGRTHADRKRCYEASICSRFHARHTMPFAKSMRSVRSRFV